MTKDEEQQALMHILHNNGYQEDCTWCVKQREEELKEAKKQRKKLSEGFNFNV